MIAKRRWFRCRALKSPGVFYCAYAALRFNRKAPDPVVSRSRNDKHKLIMNKITHGACLFAPSPAHSLQRTLKILRPAFSGCIPCASKPWSTAANRRPRSLTDFMITIKTHSQLLSTKTDFCSEMGLVGNDRGAGRASAVLRKLRVRHCQTWQAVPARIAPTHQRL
jgi:hypothetical protein